MPVFSMKEQGLCDITKAPVPNPEEELAQAERAQAIKGYLNEFSPQQREAVLYRFFGEMKLCEIAEHLQINEATVRVHLKRAMDKLRKIIAVTQEGKNEL